MGEKLPVKPFIGYVSHEDKLMYLNSADLYLHSSVVELESLTCLEAIGCGLPCLIGNSPYSAATQFALDDRFIFKMDDADDLAEKIDYWYKNRNELVFSNRLLFKCQKSIALTNVFPNWRNYMMIFWYIMIKTILNHYLK